MIRHFSKWIPLLVFIFFLSCGVSNKSKNKPYEYGWVPKNYSEIEKNYHTYTHWYNCQPGETVASIGAGNGKFEVGISCLVPGISWYLEEIDSTRLYQFDKVLSYFENLKGSAIEGKFNLVLGSESEIKLPLHFFDRVLMNNVFHEIKDREPIMHDILEILKDHGELVIMERMGSKPGQIHGDCKFPKLYEPDFLQEMSDYGYQLRKQEVGEKVSTLIYYTFTANTL